MRLLWWRRGCNGGVWLAANGDGCGGGDSGCDDGCDVGGVEMELR
ncbi:hypothetical protein Tco_0166875, partial [Tanacetum coccineum]